MLVAMGARTPDGGDTHYEPTLFRRVPADAVVAVSFGGTQGTLDRLQGQVDVDGLSQMIEEATGVSLDGIVDALSGEGVLYVRPGETLPEVTLALAPPDPDKTWTTVDRLARKLATEMQATVTTNIENGVEVSKLVVDDVTIRYARLDADTIVVRAARTRSRCSPAPARSSSTRRASAGLRRTSDSKVARRASSTSTSTGCCR